MKKIVRIESEKEYDSIVSIHALVTHKTPVEVFFEDEDHNQSMVEYPPGSFRRGFTYDINCIKLKFDDTAAFMGTIIDKSKLNALLS